MLDPRRDFLDTIERALQRVPYFTTPTSMPADTSWGTFLDSSEVLATWLALDKDDRAEEVIATVTEYMNRVNAMATEGKELCARVAIHFGDEERAAGIYGVPSAAAAGRSVPSLQLVPGDDEHGDPGSATVNNRDEEKTGEHGTREHGGAGGMPEEGIESLDIGAALLARYPTIESVDRETLDGAVELLQKAARAVAAGIDLETVVQAEADLEGNDEAEASSGSETVRPPPELEASLVRAAKAARETADLLHDAAMKLDASSTEAGKTTESGPVAGDRDMSTQGLGADPGPRGGPELEDGGAGIEPGRYVPRWRLCVAGTAVVGVAVLSVLLWLSDRTNPSTSSSSHPPQTVATVPSTSPSVQVTQRTEMPAAAPEGQMAGSAGLESDVLIMDEAAQAQKTGQDKDPESTEQDHRPPGQALATGHGARAPRIPRNPGDRAVERTPPREEDPDRFLVEAKARLQPVEMPPLHGDDPAGVVVSVPMGATVEIEQPDAPAIEISVRRSPMNRARDRGKRASMRAVARLPRNEHGPQHRIQWRDAQGIASLNVAAP